MDQFYRKQLFESVLPEAGTMGAHEIAAQLASLVGAGHECAKTDLLRPFALFLVKTLVSKSDRSRGHAVIRMMLWSLDSLQLQEVQRIGMTVFKEDGERWTFYCGVVSRRIAQLLGLWRGPLVPEISSDPLRAQAELVEKRLDPEFVAALGVRERETAGIGHFVPSRPRSGRFEAPRNNPS